MIEAPYIYEVTFRELRSREAPTPTERVVELHEMRPEPIDLAALLVKEEGSQARL